MTYIFYFTALIANYFASWRRKQSVMVLLLTLAVILLLWVGNGDGPDIANYHIHFVTSGERLFKYRLYQILYNYPMFFFREFNFSFYQYRFWVTLLSCGIIYKSLCKFNTNIHLVLFAYLCLEFFMEGIQMRNFLAIPFLLVGFVILAKRMFCWRVWFLLTIGLATSIHSSFLAYSIFVFIPSSNVRIKNKMLWACLLGAIGVIAFFFFFRSQLGFLINALVSFDETRGLHYTQKTTRLGILVPIFLQSLAIYIVNFIRLKISQCNDKSKKNIAADIQTVTTILWIDVLATYLISFCILELTFYRLIRNLLLINWVAIGIGTKYFHKDMIFRFMKWGYLFSWIIAEFVIWNDWKNILPYFFTSNLYL